MELNYMRIMVDNCEIIGWACKGIDVMPAGFS